MARTWTIPLGVAALTAVALVTIADPALAAETSGDRAGGFIRDLFFPILFTVAGVMGLAAIIKRDFGLALTLLLLAIIVSGFLMKPSPYEAWGKSALGEIFGTDTEGSAEEPPR